MGMVDRYKKSGGFLQLLQVIETCGPKKREQFMNIITEESPNWAEELNNKCLTYEKIISWKSDFLLEIVAAVNTLSFATSLKGLNKDQLEEFFKKFSHQDRKKLESAMLEINPSPAEISSSMMKVVSETRNLFNQGSLKTDKVDPQLTIPEDFESMLEKGGSRGSSGVDLASISVDMPSAAGMSSTAATAEVEKLQKKLVLLSKEVQSLRQENVMMKDKLEKIKKIA